MQRLFKYFHDARIELTKVTWPTRVQAFRLTIIVIVFSLAMALFIGAFDYIFSQGLQKLILKS